MSHGAKLALAILWAIWSLGWGLLWALTGIGIIITLVCIPVALVPFLFVRDRRPPAT